MGRVIKLLLYYFLSQLCVTSIALAGYFGWHYLSYNSFPIETGIPISISLAANAVSMLAMAWIMLRNKYITIGKENLSLGKPSTIILYISLGITAMLWMNFISDIISLPDWFKSTFALMQDNMFGIMTMAIIAPIFEEMLFRGAIEGHLLKVWKNPRYAILVSALIFGIVHLNPAQMLFAFAFGVILGEVYYHTKSLAPTIIMHFINNATSVVMMMLYPEEDTLTNIVGFNKMAVIAATSAVAFIILLLLFIRNTPVREKED